MLAISRRVSRVDFTFRLPDWDLRAKELLANGCNPGRRSPCANNDIPLPMKTALGKCRSPGRHAGAGACLQSALIGKPSSSTVTPVSALEIAGLCEAFPPEKREVVADFARFLLARQHNARWEAILARTKDNWKQ